MRSRILCLTSIITAIAACGGGVDGSSSGGQTSSSSSQAGAGGATGQGGSIGQGGEGQGGLGAGGATGQGGAGQGGSGAAECMPACSGGFVCCNGKCANLANDINNCGKCGVACGGDHPFCDGASCAQAPCTSPNPPMCGPEGLCCGTICCGAGQLCCDVQGPGPFGGPACHAPENGTCPKGCPLCN